jgi:4-deoxy-L-threo-5-hexosulose-uronate ketol-isomerase
MTTDELRETFLVSDLFQPGEVCLTYVDLDRTVIGSAVPTIAPLLLPTHEMLKAAYFTERREVGILNIGGPGMVTVNGIAHELQKLDALYVGRGNEKVAFSSADCQRPAEFYLLSYPAHAEHPTQLIRSANLAKSTLGSAETANLRDITRLIHLEGTRSCQLVMGFTQLASGSVWNTMPPHTHSRRTEIYLYFDLGDQAVVHLLGEPTATRHVIVRDREAVLSPSWSVHCGAGTGSYRFVWAMGGDNQVFADMDQVPLSGLR